MKCLGLEKVLLSGFGVEGIQGKYSVAEWELGFGEHLWHHYMRLSKSHYPPGISSFMCEMNEFLFNLKGFSEL